jgi:Ribbon-helix-helix domain
MSRKKISTTIYVTPEQSERLRLLHERTKVPVAVYIREGIDLVLRQYGHLLPGQLSLAGEPVATARPDADAKPAAIRQERAAGATASSGSPGSASAANVGEPAPERAVGGKA